jgi:pyridoxal phosphate enzyme (YggS family)
MNLQNFQSIKEQLNQFEHETKKRIELIAVSKKHTIDKIQHLIQAGQKNFGENYAQEGIEKIKLINNPEVSWHYIGPIQSNKAALIGTYFDWIHSIDRLKVYEKIKNQAELINKKINFLIQVNISGEDSKSGLNISNLDDFLINIDKKSSHLIFRGVMAIPSNTDNEVQLSSEFKLMQTTFDNLKQKFSSVDTLSMGMSNDYLLALGYGATMVRIGSKIFGERA